MSGDCSMGWTAGRDRSGDIRETVREDAGRRQETCRRPPDKAKECQGSSTTTLVMVCAMPSMDWISETIVLPSSLISPPSM